MSETSVGVVETLFLYEFDGRVDDNDHLGLSRQLFSQTVHTSRLIRGLRRGNAHVEKLISVGLLQGWVLEVLAYEGGTHTLKRGRKCVTHSSGETI